MKSFQRDTTFMRRAMEVNGVFPDDLETQGTPTKLLQVYLHLDFDVFHYDVLLSGVIYVFAGPNA